MLLGEIKILWWHIAHKFYITCLVLLEIFKTRRGAILADKHIVHHERHELP